MSELLNKTIKRTDLKPEPWHRNNGWYGHIVYFTDGSKGEIYQCTEANPDWLKEGKTLSHITRPNKYPDKPFIQTMESIEQEKEHERVEQSSPPQNNSSTRFQKRSNGGGGWKGYGGRYEDSPDIWLKKQKFISILKLYEVLMPLVVKGDIKYETIKEEVSKHLKYIIQESGMNILAPVTQAHIPSHTTIQKPAVKSVPPAIASAPAKKDLATHTSREVLPEPNLNPEVYSHQEEPTLFEQDKTLESDPIPSDLLEQIMRCPTKAKLLKLQKGLTEKQMKNKNIMEAFFAHKNKLSKNK